MKILKIRTIVATFIFFAILTAYGYADCQVTLQWDPNSESDLAGYRLFLREQGHSYDYDWPIWQGETTQCTIDQLDENSVYYFVVRAFDGNNNESGDSNEVSLAYEESLPPANVEDSSESSSSGGGSGGGGCFIDSLLHP